MIVDILEIKDRISELETLFPNVFNIESIENDLNNNPFSHYLVYLDNNKIIGFINYYDIYDRLEIANFNVLDSYQDQGIGNKLIKKDIAHLATNVEDIAYIMNWEKRNNVLQGNVEKKKCEYILDENLNNVLNVIKQNQDISIDGIAMKLNIPTSTLTSWILLLECNGLIKTLPGNRFQVVDMI